MCACFAALPRFLRWLFQAEGAQVEIGKRDWKLLIDMGKGAHEGVEAAGIRNFADATKAAKLIAVGWAASGAQGIPSRLTYGHEDLV